MFSDMCFESMDKLLEGVVNYDYSEEYYTQIVIAVSTLNDIRDDLDNLDDATKLKHDKRKSLKIAKRFIKNAIDKRDDDTICFYDLS